MSVSFDEAEMAALRAAAEKADESLEEFIRSAALQRADRHRHQVAEAAHIVANRSADLNRRLRDR